MNVYEQLSHLLDGDLPAAEARALRLRIESEPEVAAAWKRIQLVESGLSERLAFPPSAPPVVEVPVVPAAARKRDNLRAESRFTKVAAYLFAVAASLALGMWIGRAGTEPTVRLGLEQNVVEGRVVLNVGDTRITADGKIRLVMEPAGTAARGSSVENPPMNYTHAVAALAGATLTLIVDRGHAELTGPDGQITRLTAGQRQELPLPDGEEVPEVSPALGGGNAAQAARIGELQREIDRLKLEQTFTKGQLVRATGAHQPFPSGLAEPFTPAGFRARLDAALAQSPEVSVEQVDCDEYPCLAFLRTSRQGDGWQDTFSELVEDMKADGFPEHTSANEWISEMNVNGVGNRVAVFAMWPNGEQPEGANTRTKARAEALLETVSIEGGAPE